MLEVDSDWSIVVELLDDRTKEDDVEVVLEFDFDLLSVESDDCVPEREASDVAEFDVD